jgi:hypothetical protein
MEIKDKKSMKHIGWLTEKGDFVNLNTKSTNLYSQWKPVYVDEEYSGTNHLASHQMSFRP